MTGNALSEGATSAVEPLMNKVDRVDVLVNRPDHIQQVGSHEHAHTHAWVGAHMTANGGTEGESQACGRAPEGTESGDLESSAVGEASAHGSVATGARDQTGRADRLARASVDRGVHMSANRRHGVRPAFAALALVVASAGKANGEGVIARGLAVGSDDPHCLDSAEGGRVPLVTAASGLLSHQPATRDELMSRPFPVMNEPVCTSPLPEPRAQPPHPPAFTTLSQIIPVATIKLVAKWKQRLRKCLRLASKGRWAEAERVRPPDVWLPACSHMTAEAMPWNWDLSPLAHGKPAIPLAISGELVEPPTSLALAAVRAAREEGGFRDEAILDEMIRGISDDVDDERGTLLCAPHGSALRFWSVASQKTAANVTKGWARES